MRPDGSFTPTLDILELITAVTVAAAVSRTVTYRRSTSRPRDASPHGADAAVSSPAGPPVSSANSVGASVRSTSSPTADSTPAATPATGARRRIGSTSSGALRTASWVR